MKMTKRLLTMAMCGIMAATSMVSMGASAADVTVNDFVSVQSDNSIMLHAEIEEKTLTYVGYPQEKQYWCWAACAQTALKFVGVKKTQKEIYEAAKGNTDYIDETGTFADINKAIYAFDGTKFTTSTNPKYSLISNRIGSRNIVIIRGLKGTLEHDIICYGYKSDPNNNTYTLYIYDPSTIDGGKGTLTCSKTDATTYTWKVGSTTKTFTATDYMYGK